MAKTVGDLLIKLGVDGIEGVTQLKSALTGLSKAAGPADAGLIKLGKAIKAFNRDGGASRDVIAGKLSALKSLRNQAGLNGAAFRALTKDIVDYQQKLAAADKQIDETTKKVSTLAQVSSQIPGRKAGTFGSQIAAFNEELKELSVTSDKYATVLRNIQERTRSFQRAQARQGVIAAGRTGAEGPVDPRTAFQVTTELPRTTAALSLRLTELREDFANIAIGSKDYVNALREINSLESQIGDPFGTAARKQQIRGRLGQQERFGMFAPRDPVQSAIARRERKRSRRYGGFAGGGMANQPVEATGLFRTIASIGSAETKAATEMMGRSLSQVTAEINRQAAASNGSINSLQAQKSAFAQLRAGLDPTSQDFRELGKEIEKVDRRLEKLNKRRRRPTIGGIAQGLGGIAAGGVFGGPEGALGAAVGGAVGGVAGVAAGAALGAQVKMMREALGATSDYAAQLQKLEIALKGVAGPEYTNALKAANQVTKDFNVPLDVSTRGITRLSAAVIGAGGNVADAEVVFRNITSAIKATGGGAQDVESAITAMVQTFSKGKVSAEELSGQLGERLPGAVTKFAEANKMTLPELQKALKAGTVGLDELMKFIISLGPEYEETARAIANSSADAGAKAAVAFDQVRREVGEALQPIGAQLQQAFAEFVLDILPAIKAGAVAAANGMNALLKASAFLIENFKELLIVAGAAGIALALQNLIGIATALGTAFGKATVAMKGFTAASLLNPWVALAAGITAATVALVKHSRKNAEFNKSVIAGETTNKEANDRLREMNNKVQELQDRLETEGNGRMIRQLKNQLKAAKIAADDLSLAMKLATTYTVAGVEYDRMTGRPINAPTSYTPTDYADPTPDPSGKGATPMSDIELALRDQMRGAVAGEDERLKAHLQLALDMTAAQQETEDINKRINLERQAEADFALKIKQIDEEAAQKQLRALEEKQKLDAELKASLEDRKFELGMISEEEHFQLQLARERKRLEGMGASEEQVEEQLDLFEKLNSQAPEDIIARRIGTLKKEIAELTNLGNVAVRIGDAIGSSFQQNFREIISGTKSVKKALSDFFADIAEAFLAMAAEIIAKQLIMITLQTILRALGAVAGGSSAPSAPVPKDGAAFQGIGTGTLDSLGGAGPIADPKGLFTPPTIISMANGGSAFGGSPMIVGERGPELFVPSTNGSIISSERFGADMANAMAVPFLPGGNQGGTASQMLDGPENFRQMSVPFTRTSEAAMMAAAEQQTADAISNPAPLDVRFESQSINGVEYVTAEQHQTGMVQAAERGRALALAALQNSVKARRRVGL
jgi:tape measure domain-containing protein